jgi:hypothetical protein
MKRFASLAIIIALIISVAPSYGKGQSGGQTASPAQAVTIVGIVNATVDEAGRCTEVFVVDDKGVDHEVVLNDKGKALGKFNGKRVEVKGTLEKGKISVASFGAAGSGGKR